MSVSCTIWSALWNSECSLQFCSLLFGLLLHERTNRVSRIRLCKLNFAEFQAESRILGPRIGTKPWWVSQSVLPAMMDHQAKCLLKHRKLNLYSLIQITRNLPNSLKSKVNLPEESSPAKTFLKLSFMFSKIEIQITNK